MTKAQGLNPIQSTEATRRAAAGLGPSTESAPRATTFRKTNKPYPVLAVRVRDGIRTGVVADARARTEPPGGGGVTGKETRENTRRTSRANPRRIWIPFRKVRIGPFPNPDTVCPYKTDTFFIYRKRCKTPSRVWATSR